MSILDKANDETQDEQIVSVLSAWLPKEHENFWSGFQDRAGMLLEQGGHPHPRVAAKTVTKHVRDRIERKMKAAS